MENNWLEDAIECQQMRRRNIQMMEEDWWSTESTATLPGRCSSINNLGPRSTHLPKRKVKGRQRERERARKRERQRERQRDRDRQTDRQTDRQKLRERLNWLSGILRISTTLYRRRAQGRPYPPEAMMHFSPYFRFSFLFPKFFQTARKIFKIWPFPKNFSIFIRQNFWLPF